MEDLHHIPIKGSYIACTVKVGLFVLAGLAVALCGIGWAYKILLWLALGAGAMWQCLFVLKIKVEGLRCAKGQWLITKNGRELSVELYGEQLVLPWLVSLSFKEVKNKNKYHLALWRDSGNLDDLRKLRVFLRFSVR